MSSARMVHRKSNNDKSPLKRTPFLKIPSFDADTGDSPVFLTTDRLTMRPILREFSSNVNTDENNDNIMKGITAWQPSEIYDAGRH